METGVNEKGWNSLQSNVRNVRKCAWKCNFDCNMHGQLTVSSWMGIKSSSLFGEMNILKPEMCTFFNVQNWIQLKVWIFSNGPTKMEWWLIDSFLLFFSVVHKWRNTFSNFPLDWKTFENIFYVFFRHSKWSSTFSTFTIRNGSGT